ncbi:MAG: isochorismatase family protein, partial [Halobacteriales archaeon]|nr:isochorismatase family protein [Halobacteriales archaeon]
TNTCVQCTCFELYNRGFEDIVVEECVGSMYGEAFHEWGLRNIDQALGRVLTLDETFDLLELA